MGIKLDISVETPLSDDDRDILAGISVMVLAIANRQNLMEGQPEAEPEQHYTPCSVCGQAPGAHSQGNIDAGDIDHEWAPPPDTKGLN